MHLFYQTQTFVKWDERARPEYTLCVMQQEGHCRHWCIQRSVSTRTKCTPSSLGRTNPISPAFLKYNFWNVMNFKVSLESTAFLLPWEGEDKIQSHWYKPMHLKSGVFLYLTGGVLLSLFSPAWFLFQWLLLVSFGYCECFGYWFILLCKPLCEQLYLSKGVNLFYLQLIHLIRILQYDSFKNKTSLQQKYYTRREKTPRISATYT